MPELRAAAPYYGPPPPLAEVPTIRAAVIGVYTDDPDDGANEGREELIAALERRAGPRSVARHRCLVRDPCEERVSRGHPNVVRAMTMMPFRIGGKASFA
jgi:dienelactone hydrolase